MNILFITHNAEMYGANKSLIDLIEGLKTLGVLPIVVVPETGKLCDQLDKLEIPYIVQDFKVWVRTPLKYKGKLKKVALFLKKFRARWITSSFNSKSVKSLHTKLRSKNIDLIYSNSSVFNFGYSYSQKYNIPHAWHFREVQEHYGIHWIYSRSQVSRSFKNSQLVFAISNYVKNNYKIKNNVSNIIVEHDSVLSESRLQALDRHRLLKVDKVSELITFGMVALIHPNKGQIEAVKALDVLARSYPNVRLIIAGGGHASNLRGVINQLDINDKVVLLGELSNPYEAFLDMDIYLMCSKKEGLGRVTLEAMASNLPIIGYIDGGTSELIKEGVNGLFYSGDFNDLSTKMSYLIENPDLIKRMGENSRKMFQKKYTNEVYAKKMLNHIKNHI